MTKHTRKSGRRRDPVYVVELRRQDDGGGAHVALVRIGLEEGTRTVSTDVWVQTFETFDAAYERRRVMMGQPGEWASWARMAQVLGADFLTGLIEAGAIETDDSARISAHRDGSVCTDTVREEGDVPDETALRLVLIEKGVPRIVARRGDRRFLIMTFDTVLEARRVWDWVRWQARSFRTWHRIAKSRGAVVLTGLVLGSMFADEEWVRAK